MPDNWTHAANTVLACCPVLGEEVDEDYQGFQQQTQSWRQHDRFEYVRPVESWGLGTEEPYNSMKAWVDGVAMSGWFSQLGHAMSCHVMLLQNRPGTFCNNLERCKWFEHAAEISWVYLHVLQCICSRWTVLSCLAWPRDAQHHCTSALRGDSCTFSLVPRSIRGRD